MSSCEYKTCIYCGEEIRAVAIKCKYCQSMLNTDPSDSTLTDEKRVSAFISGNATRKNIKLPNKNKHFISIAFVVIFIAIVSLAILYFVDGIGISGIDATATATIRNENQPLIIGVSDGASLEIPPGALPNGTEVKMEMLPLEEAPPLPRGFESTLFLYDISADHSLQREVEIRLPLPEVDDESIVMLFRYSDGEWEEMYFDVDGDFAVVSADSLSFWGWLDTSLEELRQSGDQFLMTYLDPDILIGPVMKRFDELTGLVRYTDIGLESNSPLVSFDERQTYGLISASAVLADNDLLRLRVRNNNNFYLMLYFDGYGEVSAQRGSYLDIKSLRALAPQLDPITINWLIENLPQNFILLLPEGTAEFNASYQPGESLVIQFRLDEASALYTSLDPLLEFVPIADIEIIAAMRDIMGAGSHYVENLNNLENSIYENILDATDIRNTLLRAGVLVGDKALRELISILVLPAVVEMRKDLYEGRIIDILEHGQQAKKGGRLTLNYLDIHDDEAKRKEIVDFMEKATSHISEIFPEFYDPNNDIGNDELISLMIFNGITPSSWGASDHITRFAGEDVEWAAKTIFGPEINDITHKSVGQAIWKESEQEYHVHAFGPTSFIETHVISIVEESDRYIVDVIHLKYSFREDDDRLNETNIYDEYGNHVVVLKGEENINESHLRGLPIRSYFLRKTDDGGFYISHSSKHENSFNVE